MKVTIALSKRGVDLFKCEEQKNGTQYQRMIRRLLDSYSDVHLPILRNSSQTAIRRVVRPAMNPEELAWLAGQLIEQVAVERHGFAGAGALDVLHEITRRIVDAAKGDFVNSPDDFLHLLLAPGAVTWVREGHQFLDEIAERIDFGRSSLGDRSMAEMIVSAGSFLKSFSS